MARRSGEKYRAIIEAAVKVIAENGYHNSQVAKIAREAGVADGTIYLYFQNKEDVLISLFRIKLGDFTNAARNALQEIDNPFERLARLITLQFQRMQNDRALASVLQIQLRQSEPTIRRAIAKIIKEYYNFLEEIIADGVNKGAFSRDIDIKVARKMIFGTLDEITTCWVLSSRQYDLLTQARPAYRLLARALSVDGTFPDFPAILGE